MAAVALTALSMVSCSDFLDQSSPSEQTTETTYENAYYTGLVVNKIYGLMGQDQTYSQVIPIIWGAGTDTELIDGLGSGVETVSERGYMNYRQNESSWAKPGDWWREAYNIIEYCNLVEQGVRASSLYKSGSAADKAQMGRYLGEALAIRAMMYHDIIRMWGDVPMKFEPTKPDLSNASLDKTDRDIILDNLLTQLEEAISLLPWAGENQYTAEHVTKGYAKALYAQIAMTRAGYAIRETAKEGYETAAYSDGTYPTQRPAKAQRDEYYRKAALQLAEVIKSEKHDLNPSFENEWKLLNQLTLDQTYKENLFEIPMLNNVTGELGYTVGKRMNGVTSDFGYGNSSGKLKTTATLFYSYREGDQRRDVTCATTQFSEDAGTTKEAFIGNAPFGIYIGKWRPEWESESWLAQNKAASAKHLTGINVVRMRYSQVLLYYAECLNELVGADLALDGAATSMTARQALARVHTRAFSDKTAAEKYVNGISQENFFDALVQENAWELTGEGFRKFDLVRWGILAQKIADMKAEYAKNVTNWPTEIYFNYADDGKTRIDMSSVTWQGVENSGKPESAYDNKATGFGLENDPEKLEKNAQYTTNLPRICEGLVGTTTDGTIGEPVNIAREAVKNRYLLPLTTAIISDSDGKLRNSYGY